MLEHMDFYGNKRYYPTKEDELGDPRTHVLDNLEDYPSLQALVEYESHQEKDKEKFWSMFREFFGLYPWWKELGPQVKDEPNVMEENAPGWWWLLDEPFEPEPIQFPIGESGTVDPPPRNFGSYYATHPEERPYSRWITTRRK